MGVSSSESHDLTAFYELLTASFGVLSQNTGFYPSLDRIVETTLGPLNLGPGGRCYNEPISRLQRPTVAEIAEAKAWVASQSCRAWCKGYCMVNGTLVKLEDKPGHHSEAYFDRKSQYSLNVQVCHPLCFSLLLID